MGMDARLSTHMRRSSPSQKYVPAPAAQGEAIGRHSPAPLQVSFIMHGGCSIHMPF
jgi:hypothetical protein